MKLNCPECSTKEIKNEGDGIMSCQKCDLIFAIGGDGTILSTVRRLNGIMKPIMGIHIGSLGFLSECTEETLESSIDLIIRNQFTTSNRMILQVDIVDFNGNIKTLWALNDIVLDHGNTARMLKVKLEVPLLIFKPFRSTVKLLD